MGSIQRNVTLPLVVFNVPTSPYHQFLTVGRHCGNVTITYSKRYCFDVTGMQLLDNPHTIAIMHVRNHQLSIDIDTLVETADGSTDGFTEMFTDLSQSTGQAWKVKCEVTDYPNNGCLCTRGLECTCSKGIMLRESSRSLSDVIQPVSRMIIQTIEKTIVGNHFGDSHGALKVEFAYGGTTLTAHMVETEGRPVFAAMIDVSKEVLERCQDYSNYATCFTFA